MVSREKQWPLLTLYDVEVELEEREFIKKEVWIN